MKKFRKAKGLRQADLAKEIGSTDGTINRVEIGIRIARSPGKLVAEVFEV